MCICVYTHNTQNANKSDIITAELDKQTASSNLTLKELHTDMQHSISSKAQGSAWLAPDTSQGSLQPARLALLQSEKELAQLR